MAPGYNISAIGYPMMGYSNGLGNYGLETSGSYGSYDNYMPNLGGIEYGIGNMPSYTSPYGGLAGMNGLTGMYGGGMYYPTFMAQMQNQMEKMQVEHMGNMHTAITNNDVRAYRESDKAIVAKLLTDASVQQDVQNLYDKVVEGDQNGICEEFDKLRNQIYHTYKNELEARGSEENPAVAATRYIEALYANIVKAQENGRVASLKEDIKRFGDGAATNGFLKGYRPGHHDKYVDETLNYCFGERIDQRKHKESLQTGGEIAGKVAGVVEKGAIGAGVGAATYAVGFGALKGLTSPFNLIKGWKPLKHTGKVAVIAAVAAMIGDIIWQHTGNNN